ncbi:MAG: HAMP domain-containing protein, partial [Clostridiales bacterium]|nr:HAMP domain-containing protein [Clostridiales bacterium]
MSDNKEEKKGAATEAASAPKSVLVSSQTDVEATLRTIKQEREAQSAKRKKRNALLTALIIIFFPVTLPVIGLRKLFRKLNLPLTVKMTVLYSILFALVLTAFTVFFVESIRRQSHSAVTALALTASMLVIVVSALYAAMVWLTSQFMLRPIRSITNRIDEITTENLSTRLDQGDGQDELMELTNRINRMLDNLQESFDRQQNFVADASHELKTPIAVIHGYAEMLQRWGKDDPAVLKEGIDAIFKESENMERIVAQLLLLARLGNFSLNASRFNLVEVTAEITETYKLVDNTHEITFVQTEDAITVETDKNLLTECLRALIDNAIKYTPDGGSIKVRCALTDGHAEISVTDTGIGISAEDLPHVFERFYRCDKARGREKGSSGLGLSIAKSIAETMHSTLT